MISRLKYFQYQTNNYRYYQDTFVKCVTTVSMSVQCNYTHVTVCVEQQEVYVVAEGLNVTDKATSSNVLVWIKERLCFRSAEKMNYTKTVFTCINLI